MALGLAAVTASSPARASDTLVTFPVESAALFLRPPELSLNGSGASRRIVGLPVTGDGRMYGVSAAIHMGAHDAVDLQTLSLGFDAIDFTVRYARSGGAGPTNEGANGGVVSVTRGAQNLLELSGLACGGIYLAYQHFMFRANVDWGVAYLWSQASARSPDGTTASGLVNGGSSLFVHVPVAACLLLQPYDGKNGLEGGCLTVTPNVYEFGPFTGLSVGLRVDL
jgi:hypothetical protein